jgi:hypothetical protein
MMKCIQEMFKVSDSVVPEKIPSCGFLPTPSSDAGTFYSLRVCKFSDIDTSAVKAAFPDALRLFLEPVSFDALSAKIK